MSFMKFLIRIGGNKIRIGMGQSFFHDALLCNRRRRWPTDIWKRGKSSSLVCAVALDYVAILTGKQTGLNPAFQTTLHFDAFRPGKVNRAQRKCHSIGGKGRLSRPALSLRSRHDTMQDKTLRLLVSSTGKRTAFPFSNSSGAETESLFKASSKKKEFTRFVVCLSLVYCFWYKDIYNTDTQSLWRWKRDSVQQSSTGALAQWQSWLYDSTWILVGKMFKRNAK